MKTMCRMAGEILTEFLASIELNLQMAPVDGIVRYQDSCHLAHGQRVRTAPRKLLAAIPGLQYREMRGADICCGSAGIYNVIENRMSMQILASKMEAVNSTGAGIISTANPGCMLQLEAGVRLHSNRQRVMHVVELLAEVPPVLWGRQSCLQRPFRRLFRTCASLRSLQAPAESRRQPGLAAPQSSAYSLFCLPQTTSSLW